MTATSKTSRSFATSRRPRPLGKPTRIQHVSRLIWVVFITILVWVWADLEQTKTQDVTAVVKVVPPPDSDIRIEEPGPEGVQVHFTVRGPQGRINEFRRRLREDSEAGNETAAAVQAEPSWGEAKQLTTTQVLNQWYRLRQASLTAEMPDLESIQVRLDRWLKAEATVRLRTSDDAALVEPSEAPAAIKVEIRVPASRYSEVKDDLVVLTEVVDLTDEPQGKDITRSVKLQKRIGDVPIQIVGENEVEVTFRIGERTMPKTFTVPVQVLGPRDVLNRIAREGYTLVLDPNIPQEWRLKVVIRGPRKEVEKVDDKKIHAFVSITEDDLTPVGSYPYKDVTIALPPDRPGLKIEEPKQPRVWFRFDAPPNGSP